MRSSLVISIGLILVVLLLVTGCLPLMIVGTTSEDVLASRQETEADSSPVVNSDQNPQASTASQVEIPSVEEPEENTEQETKYAVGDRGPAGGFVFYDKGNYSEGWRYMELAPMETEGSWMIWGALGIAIGETSEEIGAGFDNTQKILSVLGSADPKTGSPYPALICDQLVYNGFNDWYLPSIDELKLVYSNLIATHTADFPEDINATKSYWSSSEDFSSGNSGAFIYYMIGTNGLTSGAGRDYRGVSIRAARRF